MINNFNTAKYSTDPGANYNVQLINPLINMCKCLCCCKINLPCQFFVCNLLQRVSRFYLLFSLNSFRINKQNSFYLLSFISKPKTILECKQNVISLIFVYIQDLTSKMCFNLANMF